MFKSEIKSKTYEDISILIKIDNHPYNYICDCGDASDLTVKEIQNTNAIFISHTHIDHFVNFDTILRHQIGIQRRVVICGPKGIAEHVQLKIKGYTWNLINEDAITYEIREILSENNILVYEIKPPYWELKKITKIQDNIIFKEKSFVVSAVILDHKIPSIAYKFVENDTVKIDISTTDFTGGKWIAALKEAFLTNAAHQEIIIRDKSYIAKELFHMLHVQKGDSLGIIMDHAANEPNHTKIKEHFYQCNKVYIESFYKNEDKEQAELNYHSYASISAQIMKLSEVVEAIPVHFSRRYKEDDVTTLIQEFETALVSNE
ncbi:MBL fold metallo-hydrolase [Aquimarina algicola]|uniref:Peptidase n=1 Tax=Aquimarina algicola TaxID=2589995 RepID=A0A504J7I2_9FLAO|nr:peptidase [Aquimarina algicola]TPN86787.1 peptidase [Aquimarina algicola]